MANVVTSMSSLLLVLAKHWKRTLDTILRALIFPGELVYVGVFKDAGYLTLCLLENASASSQSISSSD